MMFFGIDDRFANSRFKITFHTLKLIMKKQSFFYYLQVNYILRNVKATLSKQKRIIFHLSDKAIACLDLTCTQIYAIYTNVYIFEIYRLKIFFSEILRT